MCGLDRYFFDLYIYTKQVMFTYFIIYKLKEIDK